MALIEPILCPAPAPAAQPTLVFAPHPLLGTGGRQFHFVPYLRGESIADYLQRLDLRLDQWPVVLWLNDRPVPRPEWSTVCPRYGDVIYLRAIVEGGGDGGSNPVRIALQIGLMLAAPGIGNAIAGAFELGAAFTFFGTAVTWGQIFGAAISIAGGLLINALLPPPKPNLSAAGGRFDSPSPTYSLAGGANRARPYEPLPWVMGRHRIVFDLASRPYTEIEGEDQFLYQVFNAGLGDVMLSDFRIGNTPISAYAGVEIQVSAADGALTLFPGNVDTQSGGSLTAAAGWVQRTSSINAIALAVEITGTLYRVGDTGTVESAVTLELEYREVGATTWLPMASEDVRAAYSHYWSAGRWVTRVYDDDHDTRWIQVGYGNTDPNQHTEGESFTVPDDLASYQWRWRPYSEINGGLDGTLTEAAPAEYYTVRVNQITLRSASSTPVRRTFKVNVDSGQYEVRVRRVTPDSTDGREASNMTWAQLRTYQPDPADYRGQTRIALKIKASGQLQGTVDQFNALATARAVLWDGVAWVPFETSNPAWWFYAVARGLRINGRVVAGAGLADAEIDLEAIKAFAGWCDAKRLTFNGVFDRPMTCAEMLIAIARCGRGAPTRSTGKLGVIWDAPNQPVTAMFGMANIKRRTFQVQYVTGKLADEVAVGFINPDLDWQRDEVRALVPGTVSPATTVTIELFGCTDRDMAGREANLLAANHVYRRRFVTWQTDVEGLIPARGDVVGMSHDLTAWGYSGRLVAGTTSVLTLDREVPFTPGLAHYVGVRFPDGGYDIYEVVSGGSASATLTLVDPLPSSPNTDANHPPCDYLWFFDPKPTPGRKLKVTGVTPRSLYDVQITAVDEQDEYYLAESNVFTHVPPGSVVGGDLPRLSGLQVTETLIRAGSVYMVNLTVTWDASGLYDHAIVSGRIGAEPLREIGRTFARRFEWTVPDGGTVEIQVLATDALGRFEDGGRATIVHTIAGSLALPPDVPWAAIDGDIFTWGTVNVPDLSGYRWKWIAGDSRDWAAATPLHTGVVMAGPWTPAVRPPAGGTYLVKAVDTGGRESANAAAIATDLGDPIVDNVVETLDLHALGFPGTLTRCSVVSGVLVADDASGLAWAADPSTPGWSGDADAGWPGSVYHALVYETQFTPDPAPAGSKITIAATIAGVHYAIDWRRNGNVPGWTDDADPGWGVDDAVLAWSTPEYQPWPGVVLSANESYDLRITVGQGAVQGTISALTITIDAPDVVEHFDDVAISAAGTRLPIAATYAAIKNVQLTLQADGGGGRTIEVIDKNESLGPLVKVFDATHTATTGVVDARIQGY